MKGSNGPPVNAEAKGRIIEENDGEIKVGKCPSSARKEEIGQLRESVDWEDAPDWARLLYLELEDLRDND